MSAQSEKIRRELGAAVAKLERDTAEKLLEKVREATPVRTGYTRSRWTIDEAGVSNDAGDAVLRLNDGHSRKAAAGFIERAIDETTAEMQREVNKR